MRLHTLFLAALLPLAAWAATKPGFNEGGVPVGGLDWIAAEGAQPREVVPPQCGVPCNSSHRPPSKLVQR